MGHGRSLIRVRSVSGASMWTLLSSEPVHLILINTAEQLTSFRKGMLAICTTNLDRGLKRQTRPKEERTSARIGEIKNRTFSALATSASLIYEVTPGFFAGSTYLHSFRPPTLEELYSEGPHLAAYSFEIGNPNLDSERGVGLELFLRYRNGRFRAEMAGYRNQFSNFIYARDTGEQSINNPSLNHYQFV